MLVEGMPDLYGRIDLLTEDDTPTLTDIKTSRGKWSDEQVEDSGEQLLLYSKLASEISPSKKVMTRFFDTKYSRRSRSAHKAALRHRSFFRNLGGPAPQTTSSTERISRGASAAFGKNKASHRSKRELSSRSPQPIHSGSNLFCRTRS